MSSGPASVSGPSTTRSDGSTPHFSPSNSIGGKVYGRPSVDNRHPSLNSTPEDFAFDPRLTDESKWSSTMDLGAVKMKMLSTWDMLLERSQRRLELLETTPLVRIETYETDVISSGVLTIEEAKLRLDLYRNVMCKEFALVQIPENLSVEQFRMEQPALFLVVMSVASLIIKEKSKENMSMTLHNRAFETVIYDTMIVGNKTFELLQCLVLMTLWYNEPALYHHQKCHLLTNLAVNIATDLGIGGTPVSTRASSLKYERVVRPQVLLDPKTLECRKLWLAAYCSNINFITGIRKPLYSVWSKYNEECCDLIEKSNLPESEKIVVTYARMTRLYEEILKNFYINQDGIPADVSDSRTKFLIKYYEKKLKEIRSAMNPRFEGYYQSLQLFLHQIALYIPFSDKLGRSPFSEYSLAIGVIECTPEVVESVGWCLSSSKKYIDWILKMADSQLALMPLVIYTRAVFAASILMKLRALCLTSTQFNEVCPIDESDFKKIYSLLNRLDKVFETYSFCNVSVTTNFAIGLLLCHFERNLNAFTAEMKETEQDVNKKKRNGTFVDPDNRKVNGSLQIPQTQRSNLPGSPLEILSTVASGTHDGNFIQTQNGPANGNVIVNFNGEEEAYPTWLTGDDFWKDLVPNVEAFTGFDVL